jgi:hypothetical protein
MAIALLIGFCLLAALVLTVQELRNRPVRGFWTSQEFRGVAIGLLLGVALDAALFTWAERASSNPLSREARLVHTVHHRN